MGPIPGETVRRRGVAPEAPAPVYFADEAGLSGAEAGEELEDPERAKKLEEAYDSAARAQELAIAKQNLRKRQQARSPEEKKACKGKKKKTREKRWIYEPLHAGSGGAADEFPKAEPVKLYHEVKPGMEQLVYLFIAWGVMDRHIPYHKPQVRKPKPQAKEPQKSEAVEKKGHHRRQKKKRGITKRWAPRISRPGGGASGGDPGEDPPDPEKKGSESPAEDEATPKEEEGKEEEEGIRGPFTHGLNQEDGFLDVLAKRGERGERGRGEMENHLTILERGFLRTPEAPSARTLITQSWRTSRADRKKGPQWNELKDNELHGYLKNWAHAVLEYKRASKKAGQDARTIIWYEFVYRALARAGTDLLKLFRRRREQREP
ncbi:hypothetical protein KFL_010470030 [Klebsormidium nitens]|uniref:Uncharacterized protein n=1 Tax=Klebsormidium nitens TaxID=105231 RepID=A0A1Y1ITA1_KLENI|nr:hypothetical protein KFL_010470030 [Klebsormidium nitens]|eukprot:GAQ92551.1 hypothetical protein KFL_010470030 [Klebsormidium nitens]